MRIINHQHQSNQSPLRALVVLSLLVLTAFSCGEKETKTTVIKDSTKKEIEKESPLFKSLDPKVTGLDFVNKMIETEVLNPLAYEYIYNGGGVAIGDINNDGLPDVFFSESMRGGQLFLNKGNMKFENITRKSGVDIGGFATGTSMVDINADGYMDIYVCRSLSNQDFERENVLLINNGDLTFTNKAYEYGLADKGYSNYATFLDYDNDGDLDVYVINHRIDFKVAVNIENIAKIPGGEKSLSSVFYKDNSDRFYRNEGNGKFTDVTEKAGLINRGYSLSTTVADINKDGFVDIFVANDYTDKDHFYINNGDGTFTDKLEDMFRHISKHSMGTEIVDFDNDGDLDQMTVDMVSENNYRQKQLGWISSYDLYHLIAKNGMYHQVVRNTLQLNNGDGTFSEVGQLSGISHTDWSWTPLFADFDNDGYKDLFISNGYYRDGSDMDYKKYESNEIIEKAGGQPYVKDLDLVKAMRSTPLKNYVFKNNGDLTFTKKSKEWGLIQSTFSQGSAYADLDMDGDLDLVVNNLNGKATLYQNNANELIKENNYLKVELVGPVNNPKGIGATVTLNTEQGIQLQEMMPYRGFFSSSQPQLHFGLGNSGKEVKAKVEWIGGKVQEINNVKPNQILTVNYVDAVEGKKEKREEKPTLLSKHSNSLSRNYIHKEDDFIDFKREPLLEHMISNKGPFLVTGDVNGDELEDIVLGGGAGQPTSIFLQKSSGDFSKAKTKDFIADTTYEDQQLLLFDCDGDNDLDLYAVSGGYAHEKGSILYQDRLYINDGKGNFKRDKKALPETFENGVCVASNDIDGDGDLDLFIGGGAQANDYPYDNDSRLLLNEGGVFKDASDQLPRKGKLGMVNDAAWVDLDGDSKNELVLVGEWMPITILKYGNSKFEDVTESYNLKQTAGWWNRIAVSDLNKDGKMDLIVGNRGDNAFFDGTPQRPAKMYAKDFDGNGSIDAIPFYYFEDNQMHPKHTLDEIFAHFPTIKRKFPRYKNYSNAVLKDLFTTEDLNGALILPAHNFSSSIIMNNGNGTMTVKDLPFEGQLSELHGILPIDVNNDGFDDLILGGNNYGTDVETGRSDANFGSVLINDGEGNFKAMKPLESGLSVLGDTRGTYLVNQNGKSLIVVLRNQDSPVLYQINKTVQ